MTFEFNQQIFVIFFAIFWGAVFNVVPRWKAFQLPLMFRLKKVLLRVILALLLLNVLPIIYFGYIFWCIDGRGPQATDSEFFALAKIITQGILPAFGIFGLYRLWLGIIELCPWRFYHSCAEDMPEKYRHVEPTYRWTHDERKTPVVDLGKDGGTGNLIAALIYLLLSGGLFPWLL